MSESIRQPMEQAFGADFSQVKIHANSESDRLSRSIHAKAFTTGQDVFFRQGAYAPETRAGQESLAHELTHVLQQNQAIVQTKPADGQMLQMKSAIPSKSVFHEQTKSYYYLVRDGFLEDIDTWLELFSELNDEFEKETSPSERLTQCDLLIDLLQELNLSLVRGIKLVQGNTETLEVLKNVLTRVKTEQQQKEEAKAALQENSGAEAASTLEQSEQGQTEHKGSAKSLFSKVANIVKTAVPNPGDSKEIDIRIQFPVAPAVFIGGKFFARAQQLQNQHYRIRCEIMITASANYKIADLNAGIGGYLEVQAENPDKALQLVSYAFYRRLVESKYIPVEASNYIWGGTSKDFGYKLAERWAGKVENDNFGRGANPDAQNDSYVEMGALAEVSGQVGIDGLNINAGVRGSIGSRIDRRSIQVNKLIAEFGLAPEKAIEVVQVLSQEGAGAALKTYEKCCKRAGANGDESRIIKELKKENNHFLGVSHAYQGRGDAQRSVAKGVAEVQSWINASIGGLSGGCDCTGKWATNDAGQDYTFQELSLNAYLSAKLPVPEFITTVISEISTAANRIKSQPPEVDGKTLTPSKNSAVDLSQDSKALTEKIAGNQNEADLSGSELQASYSLLYEPAKEVGKPGSTSHQIMVTYSSSGSPAILFSASKKPGDTAWQFSSFGIDLTKLSPAELLFKEFLSLKQELDALRSKNNPHREAEIIEQILAIVGEQEIRGILANPEINPEQAISQEQTEFLAELRSLTQISGDLNLASLTDQLNQQKAELEVQIKDRLQGQFQKRLQQGAGKVLEIAIPEIGSLKSVFNTLKQAMQIQLPTADQVKGEEPQKFILKAANIPLGDFGNIPIQLTATAQHTADKQYKLRCNLAIVGAPPFLSKLQVELGGYAEVQAATVEQANDLLSYGFYRRLVESKYIPVQISNYFWGGTASSAGYARAEQWAAQVETDAFAAGESNPNAKKAYVETGVFGAANFKNGDQQVTGELRSGGRYHAASIQVNKLIGELGVQPKDARDIVDCLSRSTDEAAQFVKSLSLEEQQKTTIVAEILAKGANAFLGMTHTYTGRGDTQRRTAQDIANLEISAQINAGQLAGTLKGLANWQKDITGKGALQLDHVQFEGTATGTMKFDTSKIKDAAEELVNAASTLGKYKPDSKTGELMRSSDRALLESAGKALGSKVEALLENIQGSIPDNLNIELEAAYKLFYAPNPKESVLSHQVTVTCTQVETAGGKERRGARHILFSATKDKGDWTLSAFGLDVGSLTGKFDKRQLFKEFFDLRKELETLRTSNAKGNGHREAELLEQLSALLDDEAIAEEAKETKGILSSMFSSSEEEYNSAKFMQDVAALVAPARGTTLSLDQIKNYLNQRKAELKTAIEQELKQQIDQGVNTLKEEVLSISLPKVGSLKSVFDTLDSLLRLKLPEATSDKPQKIILKATNLTLGDLGTLPVELSATAQTTPDDGYKVRCNLSIAGAPKIPGLDKLETELGGYAEAQAANPTQASQLISYAFYRRLVESKYIPVQISNYLWGGTAMSAGYGRAERWAGKVENDAFATNDSNPNAKNYYVETGLYAAANAQFGRQRAAGEVRTGRQFNQQTIQVSKLIGEFGIAPDQAKDFVEKLTTSTAETNNALVREMNLSDRKWKLTANNQKKLAAAIKAQGMNAGLGAEHTYRGLGDTQRHAATSVTKLDLSTQVQIQEVVGKLAGSAYWSQDITGEGKSHLQNLSLEGTATGTLQLPAKLKATLESAQDSNVAESADALVASVQSKMGEVINTASKLCTSITNQAAKVSADALKIAEEITKAAQSCMVKIEEYRAQIRSTIEHIISTMKQVAGGLPLKLHYQMSYVPSSNGTSPGKVIHTITVTCLDDKPLLTATRDTDWNFTVFGQQNEE